MANKMAKKVTHSSYTRMICTKKNGNPTYERHMNTIRLALDDLICRGQKPVRKATATTNDSFSKQFAIRIKMPSHFNISIGIKAMRRIEFAPIAHTTKNELNPDLI